MKSQAIFELENQVLHCSKKKYLPHTSFWLIVSREEPTNMPLLDYIILL